MKRRTLLLALGGGSAVGTGAVSEISAERGVRIAASADSNGLVQLEPINDGDILDELTVTQGGEIRLTITELSSQPGDGVNTNAVTAFDELIQVTNRGADPVAVRFTSFGAGDITAEFYTGNAPAQDPRDNVNIHTGDENALPLNIGESENLGVLIDTSAVGSATGTTTDSVTITAGVGVDAGQNS